LGIEKTMAESRAGRRGRDGTPSAPLVGADGRHEAAAGAIMKKACRIAAVLCAAFCWAANTQSPACADGVPGAALPGATECDTINLPHDLVRLGIATRNLPPDSPSTDARPLFQAALLYVESHLVRRITVDRGAYYFLTPQDATAFLRFVSLSDLTGAPAGRSPNAILRSAIFCTTARSSRTQCPSSGCWRAMGRTPICSSLDSASALRQPIQAAPAPLRTGRSQV
jgi:hypothetical protein